MKLFKILSLSLIAFSYCPAQDCKAELKLSSDIDNTEYYLNETRVGEGMNLTIQSDTGSYILTARESGNIWNPLTLSETVDIIDCGEYKFSFLFSSVLYLKSEPSDAYVFRNDSLLGNTPLYISRGSGTVRLVKPGYRDAETSGFDLNNIINLEETGKRNGTSFYERNLFKYLIGGLVVLGGTTAYFKLEADKKFDRYQLTGSDSYLKDTKRYDLISGITLGALQINFGLLLYYFLSE
jgi:hypothetical protein